MVAKKFSLVWAFESFSTEPGFATKRMFGGLAVYLHGRMVMFIFEDANDQTWNGICFPTMREHHESILHEFPDLVNHAVLPKWLYLPMLAENFESAVGEIAERIMQDDPRFGIYPKQKKQKVAKRGPQSSN